MLPKCGQTPSFRSSVSNCKMQWFRRKQMTSGQIRFKVKLSSVSPDRVAHIICNTGRFSCTNARRFYFKTATNFCYRWALYVLWVLQCCSYIVMLSKISLSIGVTSPQQLAVASITNVQGVSWKTGFCLLFKNTREFVTPCLPYNAHPHLLLPLSQLLNGLTITFTKQNCLKWRFGVFQQWCQILNSEFTRNNPPTQFWKTQRSTPLPPYLFNIWCYCQLLLFQSIELCCTREMDKRSYMQKTRRFSFRIVIEVVRA